MRRWSSWRVVCMSTTSERTILRIWRFVSLRQVRVPLFAAALAILLIVVLTNIPLERYDYVKPLTRDAVYLGGATIVALAVFGSALGIGITAGKGKKLNKYSVAMVSGGTTGVAFTQGLSMMFACCIDFSMAIFGITIPALLTLATITFTVPVMLGFAQIADDQTRSGPTEPNKEQLPAQDDAATELLLRFDLGQGTVNLSFTSSGGQS